MKIKKTEREDKILASAEKVLREQGVVDFNMSDIARDSGYSRAGVYQLYPTKNTLLFALCFHELVYNIDKLKKRDFSKFKGSFTFVMRPMFTEYLRLQDKNALDATLDDFMKTLNETDSDEPKIIAMKRGFEYLMIERKQGAR